MVVYGGVCPRARREIWSLTASMPRCPEPAAPREEDGEGDRYRTCDLSAECKRV